MLSDEEQALLVPLANMKFYGTFTLSSGRVIPLPRSGFHWFVETDGRLVERADS